MSPGHSLPISEGMGQPQALEAERSVLAAMLLNAEAIGRARALLDFSSFHLAAHAKIFAAVLALADRGEWADGITVTEELRRRGDLEACGGPASLCRVYDYAGTSANVEAHARIVREAAAKRDLRHLGFDMQSRAEDPTQSAAGILMHLGGECRRIAEKLSASPGASRRTDTAVNATSLPTRGLQ